MSRNTPTGVGKTSCRSGNPSCPWKHPHGRGEDARAAALSTIWVETPPRAWGRLMSFSFGAFRPGNTPTGVGKTLASATRQRMPWKHPHGRGEELSIVPATANFLETPPRAWGRPKSGISGTSCCGNTPTGVGKTRPLWPFPRRHWKHPHGRGEDKPKPLPPAGQVETPPRAWGRPH